MHAYHVVTDRPACDVSELSQCGGVPLYRQQNLP